MYILTTDETGAYYVRDVVTGERRDMPFVIDDDYPYQNWGRVFMYAHADGNDIYVIMEKTLLRVSADGKSLIDPRGVSAPIQTTTRIRLSSNEMRIVGDTVNIIGPEKITRINMTTYERTCVRIEPALFTRRICISDEGGIYVCSRGLLINHPSGTIGMAHIGGVTYLTFHEPIFRLIASFSDDGPPIISVHGGVINRHYSNVTKRWNLTSGQPIDDICEIPNNTMSDGMFIGWGTNDITIFDPRNGAKYSVYVECTGYNWDPIVY